MIRRMPLLQVSLNPGSAGMPQTTAVGDIQSEVSTTLPND